MRILEIEITPIYSCQYCGKDFESNKDYRIDLNFYPVCSHKCGFNVIYNFLKKQPFSDENLLEMQKKAENKTKIIEFNRQKAIFSIAKYYKNLGLSNIKFILMNGQGSVQMDKNLTYGQMDNNCVCYNNTQCPLSCPQSPKSPKKSFVHSGGLTQWF